MASIIDDKDAEYRLHRQQFLSFAHGLFTAAGVILLVLMVLAWTFGGDAVPS